MSYIFYPEKCTIYYKDKFLLKENTHKYMKIYYHYFLYGIISFMSPIYLIYNI